jgi:hypothetical protein
VLLLLKVTLLVVAVVEVVMAQKVTKEEENIRGMVLGLAHLVVLVMGKVVPVVLSK